MGNIIYRKTIRQISPAQQSQVPASLSASQTAALYENEINNSIFVARLLRLFSSVLSPRLGDVISPSQCACLHTAANSHVRLDLCQHLHCSPDKYHWKYI